ncbi:uncharacterized protein LOC105685043 [Athalia rosae]|uniref:uncharacterized protein LOC105685043 n=1 Tax=Athalia rosae TaxID=37344 RepID=UPI002033AAB7|nr:uncharacterized protein LOC105685043 [Athalia rosae]XP_020707504.2 uncharacterized protein LOC105685043 [Athalia rosae]XP_048506079.1 uncharacterized protein LOC105685043 [Athalia rosae]XP_048506086.1 uncharacterized protein LOC105685043 [Athalia rosae]XP_048506090.1 uncharacterized protein LOC105685043 [Athalia rosae]
MALRIRGGNDVKKCSYYVWYLGAREARGVDAMPGAIAYLLERERLQEPFKVTLQMSSKGLKIIQTVHPGGSARSAVKHLVPGHAVLAAVQREDVVAATLLLPNPATNNPVHVHAYRCDSVETAELLGGQLKALASQSENLTRLTLAETKIRSNLGSDGRSTRESESSEGSGELRHHASGQPASIYESLAAELRAKLGRGNSADRDGGGPILLPPRDYDTVHRHRGNLAGIEFRRCLNQNIVGANTSLDRGGTRSATSSGIGSDSAATPPPYQPRHPLGPRPSGPSRDSSSDDEWGGPPEQSMNPMHLGESASNLTLPRVTRSPDRVPPVARTISPPSHVTARRAPEMRQRSPSPHYLTRPNHGEVVSPRERFQDAKEMFRAMEREVVARPAIVRQREPDHPVVNRSASSRRIHEERKAGRQVPMTSTSIGVPLEHTRRAAHPELVDRDTDSANIRARPKPRTHHYAPEPLAVETARLRPRSYYENPLTGRDPRDLKEMRDPREIRDLRGRERPRAPAYQELADHERYPGLDRDSARPQLETGASSRYRHSYAEPPRLGLAALHPY